jgi:hypothetical protein
MVVVMEVTLKSPAMIQLSINLELAMPFMLPVSKSPRNNIYRPMIMKADSREKNTAVRSRKKILRFLTANLIVIIL